MSRYLMIDIGAGTMDILFFDDASGLQYKAVVMSPVRHLAEHLEALPGNIVVTGLEMGGGPISSALKARAHDFEVVMSVSSAATIHHDLKKVRAFGIKVVEDQELKSFMQDSGYQRLVLGDLSIERIRNIVEGFGVPFSFDIVGVCAQDHGVASPDMSHLDFRHQILKKALDKTPFPHALLYEGGSVPSFLNRLSCIVEQANALPTREIYVMDSGMAAILGASMDPVARSKEKILVLDVATSHTLGAALIGEEIAGIFEYHTRDITLERLETLLIDLAEGKLDHARILEEGGHGAYMRKAAGFDHVEAIIVTGPKRHLVDGSRLPMVLGAPFGDHMMTGTVGLLEAIQRHEGFKPG